MKIKRAMSDMMLDMMGGMRKMVDMMMRMLSEVRMSLKTRMIRKARTIVMAVAN